jgi:F-type H+-transporting ATPase subunit c
MDYKAMLALALPLGLGLAAVGSALGLGRMIASAMDAIGRQPEASNKIMANMIIGCAFIEALTIYVMVFAFYVVLSGKI